MSKDSEHLQWLHNRIVNVYGESENVDFLIRMREIIKKMDGEERAFENYLELYRKAKENERKEA